MNGVFTVCKPEYTKVECNFVLRMLRAKRKDIAEAMTLLEERAKIKIPDSHTQDALLALDNELYLIDVCLTRTWKAYNECNSRHPDTPENDD